MRALTHDFIERAAAGRTGHIPEAKVLLDLVDEYEIALIDQEGALDEKQQEHLTKAREAITTLTAERALPDIAEGVKLLAEISKAIHRVEMLRTAGAVSLDQVRRFLAAVDHELQLHVDDEDLRQVIRRGIYAIRV